MDECASFGFSTRNIPPAERIDVLREVYGRAILRVDIESLDDDPCDIEVQLRSMPELSFATGTAARQRCAHPTGLADSDDLIWLAALSGGGVMRHRGREAEISGGDAIMTTSAEAGSFTYRSDLRFLSLRVPSRVLVPMVGDLSGVLMRTLPRDLEAQRLLIGYLGMLQAMDMPSGPALRQQVATHVHDLLALTLGANRDAAETAKARGLRAARLDAVKADVTRRLGDPGLSVEAIAAHHGISERYVRKLFAADGSSFSNFVLAERLARARRMLTNPRLAGRSISTIAYDVGFGDLSYFNRCFRRRFGGTPSDIRKASNSGD
ncbi:AraC family transcriptional regulator [Phreatobacter stygius]|uniref:Helix-turn-helix domain-containing protein n=1 Tax=Phreatobacter stygius TaxID=1940610 RepID=A0A4D7BM96_9HYPH|nr:AraC family transcriptional regulator [Phreatobacter stygius]QCI68867.1 helix-turn-helix domain-containing protein [Phreatobacter stygius]